MTRLSVRAVELQIIISAMKLSFSKGDKIATKGKTTSLLTSRKMQFELSHVLPILAHLTFLFHLLIQSRSQEKLPRPTHWFQMAFQFLPISMLFFCFSKSLVMHWFFFFQCKPVKRKKKSIRIFSMLFSTVFLLEFLHPRFF